MGCPRPNTPRSNSKDLGELERTLRDRVYTMIRDAPAKGLVLVSGYRDPGFQWDLRHQRVPRGQECNPAYRGYPVTAIPYSSKHQKRTAADIGGRDLSWAVRNCARYGLRRTVPSEAWHYEAVGSPSVRILRYPGATYDGSAPQKAPMARNTIRLGDAGNDVKFMQDLLNIILIWTLVNPKLPVLGDGKGIAVDGKVGPRTAARIKEYEQWYRSRQVRAGHKKGLLSADGIATGPTLKAIGFDVTNALKELK